MKSTMVLPITIILTIIFEQAKAQLITDRPDQTESSTTIPIGSLQLESGILLGYEGHTRPSTRQVLLPTILTRYGMTKWIEIRVLNQFEMINVGNETFDGISDLEVGAKVQILKNERFNTEIAFLSQAVLPTGSFGVTGNTYGVSNKLCVSHSLSTNIGVGYNFGYNYFGMDRGDLTYSLAFGIKINNKVGFYLEPYGEVADMNEFVANFDAGFTYLKNENLQFDFSFGTGINQKMNYLSIGCSWLMQKQ